MRPFPVLRLNDAITEKIPEMTSIDIPGGIATGLDPEIRITVLRGFHESDHSPIQRTNLRNRDE